MKLSDAGVLGVLTHCSRLQFLCVVASPRLSPRSNSVQFLTEVCNTEITDKCFEAIMECEAQKGSLF